MGSVPAAGFVRDAPVGFVRDEAVGFVRDASVDVPRDCRAGAPPLAPRPTPPVCRSVGVGRGYAGGAWGGAAGLAVMSWSSRVMSWSSLRCSIATSASACRLP
eukprot:scaffold28134_cov51-Isochrysis_galbana.AAC.1